MVCFSSLLGRFIKRPHRLGLAAVAILAFGVAACGVPSSMRVRSGLEPRFQDDDVRFRTTYYFRVFDLCEGLGATSGTKSSRVKTDALYRFRMTGKANALANQVRFEAGTLQEEEIEPFGASVRFDAGTKQFYLASPKQVKAEIDRRKSMQRLKEIFRLRKGLRDDIGTTSSNGDKKLRADAEDTFKTLINNEVTRMSPDIRLPNGPSGTNPPAGDPCPAGTVSRRGFQILGPEGWRSFDQSERLLMAMSSSAKPLISSLRKAAGLLVKSQGTDPNWLLLPLVRERLNAVEGLHEVERLEGQEDAALPGTSKEVVDKITKAFEAER